MESENNFILLKSLDNKYLLNKKGELKSIKRFGSKGRILKIQKGKHYLFYRVSINGKSKNILMHRLIAQTFIPNPENKPQVNHIDGNKHNNSIENLEWVTALENNNHAFKFLSKKVPKGKDNVLSKPVIRLSMNNEFIDEFDSVREASKITNTNLGNLSSCLIGNRKSANKYKWKYK